MPALPRGATYLHTIQTIYPYVLAGTSQAETAAGYEKTRPNPVVFRVWPPLGKVMIAYKDVFLSRLPIVREPFDNDARERSG